MLCKHVHTYVYKCTYVYMWASPGSAVKKSPAMQATWETQGQSLGWEDPLEKKIATHSSILVWKTPWTEECGGLQSIGSQTVRHN